VGAGLFIERDVPRSADRADWLAFAGVAILSIAAVTLGGLAGMSWTPAAWKLGLIPALFLAIAAYYGRFRPGETRLFQIAFYTGLWSALPLAGTQLTFIANTLGMPLQNDTFTRMDSAIGFDWSSWGAFVLSHPALLRLTTLAYESYAWQPFVAVIVLALFGPPRRNAEFVLAMTLALTITIVISALLPAIEPGHAHGFDTPAADAMLALRAGQRAGLPYVGIVSFPSFHAAMAVLFTLAYRGLRPAFYPAAALNGLMLLSVPFSGDHYLVDLLAGIAVALLALWLARQALGCAELPGGGP